MHMKITRQMFIDANIFTYLLTGHPIYGRNCQQLLGRVESGDLEAFISLIIRSAKSPPPNPSAPFLAGCASGNPAPAPPVRPAPGPHARGSATIEPWWKNILLQSLRLNI